MNSDLLSTPPLDAIRGFVAVAKRMSITMAAQDLCLTQSAVSRQIQSLEEHFKVPLFLRKHRSLELTDAGEKLFHLASPWLDRLVDFSKSVRQESRTRPVTITASYGVTALWLLPKLGAFQTSHPHIDVRVAANNRFMDLKQEGIDLAIRYCREESAPKGAIRLFGEEVAPVASKAVAARAFKSTKLLFEQVFLELDDRALPWLKWSDWLNARNLPATKPKAFLHFNQYDQVIQAAIEGHGVALGRLALILPMLRDGRLIAQPGAQLGVSDYAYWLIKATENPRNEVETFGNWLIEEVSNASDLMAKLVLHASRKNN